MPKKDVTTEIDYKEYAKGLTNNGRDCVDFYADLISFVKTRPYDAAPLRSFKGIPISTSTLKDANNWLMDNIVGKATARAPEVPRDDRPMEEKLKECRYLLDKMGFYVISKPDLLSTIRGMGYRIEKDTPNHETGTNS